jgi:hypothetical protein
MGLHWRLLGHLACLGIHPRSTLCINGPQRVDPAAKSRTKPGNSDPIGMALAT